MLAIWNARPIPRRTIAGAARPAMFSPSNRMRPPSGRIAPEMRLKKLVLPAPLGPITAVSDPAVKCRLTSLIALTPPKDFCRFSTFSMSVLVLWCRTFRRGCGPIFLPSLYDESQQPLAQAQRENQNDDPENQAVVLGHFGDEVVQNQQQRG